MRWFALTALFFVALPALAGWTRCPGSETDAGTATARPSSGLAVCLRQTTDTDPARVDANACRAGVDVIFASDIAGTSYDASLYVYQCPGTGAAGTFTDCEKILPSGVDVALTGNPVGNLEAIYSISPGWLAFDVANTGSRLLEVRLICR